MSEENKKFGAHRANSYIEATNLNPDPYLDVSESDRKFNGDDGDPIDDASGGDDEGTVQARVRRNRPCVHHKKTSRPSPYKHANIFSRMTIHWMTSVVVQIRKGNFDIEDLPALWEKDSAGQAIAKFKIFWAKQKAKYGEDASLSTAFVRFYIFHISILLGLISMAALCWLVNTSYFIRQLIEFVEKGDGDVYDGLLFVLGLGFTEWTRSIFIQQYWFQSSVLGNNLKAIISGMAYNGCCNLAVLGTTFSAGEVINICTNDAERIFEAGRYGITIYLAVIMTGGVITAGSLVLGSTAVLGAIIMLTLVPIQFLVANRISKLRKQAIANTDQRVRKVSEFFGAAKLIKMYNWENAFQKQVEIIRKREQNILHSTAYLTSSLFGFAFIIPTIAAITTLAIHVALGRTATSSQVYTIIALYNAMLMPVLSMPKAVKCIAEARPGLAKLQRLLNLKSSLGSLGTPTKQTLALELSNVTLAWPGKPLGDDARDEENPDAIVDFSISVRKGEVLAICGFSGAGKTSIISAMMGQMQCRSGLIAKDGTVALVAQQAWIQSQTVRNNICFGNEFDQEWYDRVVAACALQTDFELLAQGDQTVIGDRGINLSGGQKQRISLARAVYNDDDIYILDDPLSAVDVHVGAHLFQECVLGILKGKTIVIATHQLQYLEKCDNVLFVENERTFSQGTLKELSKTNPGFTEFVSVTLKQSEENDQETDDTSATKRERTTSVTSTNSTSAISTNSKSAIPESTQTHQDVSVDMKSMDDVHTANENAKDVSKDLPKAESTGRRGVSWATYGHYMDAVGGKAVAVLMIAVFPIAVGGRPAIDWFVGYWVQQGNGTNVEGNVSDNPDVNTYILIYFMGGVVFMLLQLVKAFFFHRQMLRASSRLHDQLFGRVIRAPMAFFDTTPAGQVLSRFSKDLDEIDARLPELSDQFMSFSSMILLALLVVCAIFPGFIIVAACMAVFYVLLLNYFSPVQTNLKRLDNKAAEPLLSHIATTFYGLSTIYAFDKRDEFVAKYSVLVEEYMKAVQYFFYSAAWFSVRLDVFSLLVLVSTALFGVLTAGSTHVSPSLFGLSLTLVNNLCGVFQFCSRLKAEVTARFSSAERIISYIKEVPQEPDTGTVEPATNWPAKGEVVFENVCARYQPDLPLVLNNLSLKFQGGDKIGIVGRTGSGKSSLTLSLFRLLIAEKGRILVDGVDIASMPLTSLRRKISVIPQDPVLFAGTIRYNLDPFEEHDDAALWAALNQSHLGDEIRKYDLGLQFVIAENGENMAVGQRQMVCLARALLKNSRILLMDEATASIDNVTDLNIQNTIKEVFKDSTVVMVAHRLETVLACDKILVLDKGQALEFDSPTNLLKNPNSHFAKMHEMLNHSKQNSDVSIHHN